MTEDDRSKRARSEARTRSPHDEGMPARLKLLERVGGGDIDEAWRAERDGQIVFVKRGGDRQRYEAEAHGLDWLRAGPLRVPRVLEASDQLVLEWLELRGRPDPAALGRGLAQLHRLGAPGFGLDRDNFIATLPQDNTPTADWPTFYVERRLRPLCEGLDRELDDLLADRDRFGPPELPARVHGDLWWGNVGGPAPTIFDPAVYGGHREIDLAMLALFGPLPDALIGAYEEVYPLADGWRERLALHQLYPLAVHARLFGGGYAARVRAYFV